MWDVVQPLCLCRRPGSKHHCWKRWHARAVNDTRLAALEEEGRQGPAQGAQSFQILQLHLARR